MNQSELLAELHRLTENRHEERNGLCTTKEIARELVKRDGICLDLAMRKVRIMWDAAKDEGRLEHGKVRTETIGGGWRTVDAYKLRDGND